MIRSIHYKNYKALRDATLRLSRFTLLLGPNGSGKSTAVQGIQDATSNANFYDIVSADLKAVDNTTVSITIEWAFDDRSLDRRREKESSRIVRPIPSDLSVSLPSHWHRSGDTILFEPYKNTTASEVTDIDGIFRKLSTFSIFSFDAAAIARPVPMKPAIGLDPDGTGLAGVLENLRDSDPERFENLNKELGQWQPEFDRILFETPSAGQKGILLRTRSGHRIRAANLSHGTLFALAFLCLTNLPDPPSIVCFEEPDRGIHPRLLREISDAMYRLSYPEDYGDKRPPVQVIATTHSPYLLDLYKDHPEEIVIANKTQEGVTFERLSEKSDFDEILQGAPLGDVWYSGILGGVPAEP